MGPSFAVRVINVPSIMAEPAGLAQSPSSRLGLWEPGACHLAATDPVARGPVLAGGADY